MGREGWAGERMERKRKGWVDRLGWSAREGRGFPGGEGGPVGVGVQGWGRGLFIHGLFVCQLGQRRGGWSSVG